MNGGAFGRRSDQDVVAEAAFLAARHRRRPVKLIWSREEDIGRGLFRGHAAARLRAARGPDGLPVAYDALVAAQSTIRSVAGRNLSFTPSPDGDPPSVEGQPVLSSVDSPVLSMPPHQVYRIRRRRPIP
ncbi:molybdopterin cofactor-binding domain-containing protein [Neorhizobium sp. DT-125]|uniref:molybdopterin cofactor-binding domain-containing protein n=1 Tax=Neorhizobium sp. DT-125 TaxID=3396163 RepID=UPI003F1B3AEA